MAFIDSVVLNLIERSCRGFQRLTGRTNVWLAVQLTNLSIIVYFVWAGLYAFNIDVELRVVAAVFCVALLYALTQTIFKTPIETYQRSRASEAREETDISTTTSPTDEPAVPRIGATATTRAVSGCERSSTRPAVPRMPSWTSSLWFPAIPSCRSSAPR